MGMHKQDGLSFATLRAAEAVIDTRSLTGAAQKLGISQPAVSMHLGRLEKAIGTPLIKKLGNRIIVKEEISGLIRQMLDLERRLRTVGYEKNLAKLKIGVCTYCAPLLLGGLGRLNKLKEQVSWRIADSKRLEEMYDCGQVDAMFKALYPSEMGPDLATQYTLRWIGSREIAEQSKRNTGAIPVVLTNAQSPLGMAAREWLRQREVAYEVLGEVDDIATAMKLVSSGIAVSPLPSFVFDGQISRLDDCVEVMPGSLDMRYGMFFDDKRFNLRLGLDIFEFLQGEMHRMSPPLAAFQRHSITHQ
ncbi:LysR family transcriptional regulator [Nitratireductor pacificus]|uniref:LysR family transcriptional regulator n=1 Tax=Nitratireductor pacificus pht-3B TaxID=391937 RepID=K2LKI3_9HYPH|nr:LysR family transcriptional regulator [Nitratireductor pacificus]EKF18239.1 LysR family transcriptional regulator [Nitratireductor pacificus pht-3B]